MLLAVKTRFFDVYRRNKNGTMLVNIPHLREGEQSGVYFIRSNRTGQVIYIGYSQGSLYKTILRHFQTWNDKRQERIVYDKKYYQVRVIYTTRARAALLEKYLILKLKPRDNSTKYENYLSFPEEKKAQDIILNAPTIGVNDDCPF